MVFDKFHHKVSNQMMQRKNKIVMVPYPAQGHVTPMIKLATSLSTFGFHPLIVLPEFIHHRMIPKLDAMARDGVSCVSIPDGLDEGAPRDFFSIEMAMEHHMPAYLDRLVRKIDEEEGGVACLIVDLLASWAIGVGRECGVAVTGFWPAMVATYTLINSIPEMLQRGLISESGLPQLQGSISLQTSQPHLTVEDLPWLIGTPTTKKARFTFWARTMDRARSLSSILVNSFPNESQSHFSYKNSIQSPTNGPTIYPIGPLKSNGLDKNPTFWEEDNSCLTWLDYQKPNSVVYISFGSWVSPIGECNVRNLALALEHSKTPFIWVLGPAWRDGLPHGYIERIGDKGKVVAWAPQVEILQHKAVGCYLTHCGWNSTMEAIQCRKSLLCFPVAGDQSLNCEYIVNVWKIGLKMNSFSIEDVNDGIRKVMKDIEMKRRLELLNEKITGEETTSKVTENLLSFVNDLGRSAAQLQLNS